MVMQRERSGRFFFVGGRLAIDFANTVRARDGAGDAFRAWENVVAFLAEARAVDPREAARLSALIRAGPRLGTTLVARALGLRAALRSVLGAIETRAPIAPRWVDVVNRILPAGAEFRRLAAVGGEWTWRVVQARRHPVGALVPIARSAAELIVGARRASVRKCANPPCMLYFDAASRPRRRWCAMAVCGNRAKVAAHYRRRRRRRRR